MLIALTASDGCRHTPLRNVACRLVRKKYRKRVIRFAVEFEYGFPRSLKSRSHRRGVFTEEKL